MDGGLCCQTNVWTILRCSLSKGWTVESGGEEEEQTWDTRSNTTTCLKTSASTWHSSSCCSRVAARRGLVERRKRNRLETVITAWLRLLKVLQKDYNNKELTNSCHSRTLIVDIFGADVTQHLGGHGLKKMERKRRQRTLILETDFRPSNALLNCFAN